MTELGHFSLYMLPFTLPWAISVLPEQPNWDPNLHWQPYESRRASPNVTFIRESQTERKSPKQTLQRTCHVRVYAFSTHPTNSLHMPLSNPTINSTVLMDKIPQQNKTNRVIFVQPEKIVSTSVINFLSAAISYKRIKTRIFALFWFFLPKKTQVLDCLISSLFLYLKLRKTTCGNLCLCVSAKPTKSGAHLSPPYVHQTNQIVTFLFVCFFKNLFVCYHFKITKIDRSFYNVQVCKPL